MSMYADVPWDSEAPPELVNCWTISGSGSFIPERAAGVVEHTITLKISLIRDRCHRRALVAPLVTLINHVALMFHLQGSVFGLS